MRYGVFDHLMEEWWARARWAARVRSWVYRTGNVCATCGAAEHAGRRAGGAGLDACRQVAEVELTNRPPGRPARTLSARRNRSRS
jgi:hypothetical protein